MKNDSSQSQMTSRPAIKPAPAPRWGPGGNSLLNLANVVTVEVASGGAGWGSGISTAFDSGVNKNLTVDTLTRPPESCSNTPESVVEIKYPPTPRGFNSLITDNEGTGGAQDDAWEWEEDKVKGPQKDSKDPSFVKKAPGTRAEEIEEATKTEEPATPAEEDEFDWANMTTSRVFVSVEGIVSKMRVRSAYLVY